MKIIYEDTNLIVCDKPAGVLIHETPAREKNTLVADLISNIKINPKLSWPDPTRPGIVHRLDKDTSGLIVVAKTPEILSKLQEQFKNRFVQKTYLALVLGKLPQKEGKIEAAITRGKAGTQKVRELNYSIQNETIRPAVTFYKVIGEYKFQNQILTLVEASPKTGRMHQIRTHLKYLGNPIVGDPLYNTKESRNLSKKLGIARQFLHAEKLAFKNPENNQQLEFTSSLPEDFKLILAKLEKLC